MFISIYLLVIISVFTHNTKHNLMDFFTDKGRFKRFNNDFKTIKENI